MKTLLQKFSFLFFILIQMNVFGQTIKVYTFQTCGATLRFGPTQTDINNTYTGGDLLNGKVTVNTQGIQEWVVPSTGYYKISMAGASGGFANAYGGRGQKLTGEIFLTAGTTLKVVVGQKGGEGQCGSSGGGGGSFFVNATGNVPLFVAGGGAGMYYYALSSTVSTSDAQYLNSGYDSYCSTGLGGTNGNGGTGSSNGWGGGGGGFYTDGTDGSQTQYYSYNGRGYAFVNGAQGGNSEPGYSQNADGGFGCGGGTHGCTGGGGGGGGYSGGGGSNQNISPNSGGGGGSFLANTVVNDSNLGFNIGDGYVIITQLNSPCALNFDGTNDYIQIPSFNFSSGNTMTIEAWVKPSNITSNQYYEITRQVDVNNTDWLLSFQDFGTILSFGLSTSNGYNELDVSITPSNFTDGNWHHIAAVYNGSNKYIYVDGVQIGTNTQTGTISNISAQNFIGSYGGSSEFFNGDIDEVRFWSTARTQSQINSNRFCEINSQSGLRAIYHFNDGQPLEDNAGNDSLNDESGNNYIGTLVNFGLSVGSSSNWVIPALGQEIAVFGNNVEIQSGDVTPVSADFTDFSIGNFTRTFKIKNNGTANLKITGITITGTNASDYSITTMPSTSILPDSSSNFIVTFIPSALGDRTATINIANIDCDESIFTFDIKGTGVNAKILDFDGVNDYVSFSSDLSSLTNFTLETWVKVKNHKDSARILDFGNSAGVNMYLTSSYATNTGMPRFVINTGSGEQQVSSSSAIPLNTWTHIAVTKSGNTATMYMNGIQVGQNTSFTNSPSSLGTTTQNFIGRSQYNNPYFNGQLEEMRIWNVAKTQANIQSNMFCQLSAQSNLVRLYHFNQGIASGLNTAINTLSDSSGNALNGTLNNFSLNAGFSNWKLESSIGLEINIQGNGITIPDGNTALNISDNTDFGVVGAGSVKTFTIQNTGLSTLTISSVYLSGSDSASFLISAISPSNIISPSSSASINITVIDNSNGVKNATLNITSNDCDESLYNFDLTAEVKSANSLAFDGNDDRITTNTTISGSYTREAWVYLNDNSSWNNSIISADGNIGCGASFHLNYGYLSAGHPCASSWINVQDPTQIPLYTWTHVAVSYDATSQEMILYKDGNVVATASSVPNYGVETINIGSWGTSYIFNGILDEVRVWNKVLPQCQIQQNMNGEIRTARSGLILNYNFNQGIHNYNNSLVTTAFDSSGNGNNGTLNNFDLTGGTTSNWTESTAVPLGTNVLPNTKEIDVFGNNIEIVNGDISPSSSDNTDWGNNVVIQQAIVKTFVIKNNGTSDPVNISNISISGANSSDFVLQSLTYPLSISANGNQSFTVTLTASDFNKRIASITIQSDDCDENNYTFELKGFCQIQPPSPVTASPANICPAGGSSDLNATSSNAGIVWYNSPTGGTPLAYTASTANYTISPSSTDTFYAESYAIISGTKEYFIKVSDLTAMPNNCGSGGGYYGYNGYGNVGFTWNDNLTTSITGIQLDLAIGVVCNPTTYNTFLNSQSQTATLTPNNWCSCTPNFNNNGITTIALNPADYNLGGSNQFRVDVQNPWFGLIEHPSISNNFAIVSVSYLDTVYSLTRTPIIVKVGCCDLTSSIPTAAGTYTSSVSSQDGAYTCYCDASGNLLLALDTIGTNAVVGSTQVSLQIGASATTAWNNAGGIIANPNGGAIMNRKWNVTPTNQPTSPVKVKYFFTDVEYDSIVARLANIGTIITTPNQLQMYKLFAGTFADPHANGATGVVLMNGNTPSINNWTYSSYGVDHSAEFLVSSFSGGGGGAGGGGIPLPVNFIKFKASKLNNSSAILKWAIANESNIRYFEIERSFDGINFISIGKLNSNLSKSGDYQYIDESIKSGTLLVYYRIKQVDENGTSDNSNIEFVNFKWNSLVSISPNPFTNEITVNIESEEGEVSNIYITDATGKLVYENQIFNKTKLDLSSLNNGLYLISIKTENETKIIKIIKQ